MLYRSIKLFVLRRENMKHKRLLALIPFLAMGMTSLTACSKKNYTIGICQLVTHSALDAATNGFMDAVKKGLGEENVKFDLQNAAGEANVCTTIVGSFVSKNVDLIMANATPALQAAANATLSIPILGTSITEYGTALKLNNFNGTVGGNISGTSDLAPLDEQASMVHTLFPEATKIGLLYCSAEANSKYQIDVVKSEFTKMGLTTTEITFENSNDISMALTPVAPTLDVLYIPTDNTCASNASIIDNICSANRLPVFAGEEGICQGCGAFTLSISYYNIGQKTGEMAVSILKDKANISNMPIAYDEHPVKKYNKTICERLGITPPAGYEEI